MKWVKNGETFAFVDDSDERTEIEPTEENLKALMESNALPQNRLNAMIRAQKYMQQQFEELCKILKNNLPEYYENRQNTSGPWMTHLMNSFLDIMVYRGCMNEFLYKITKADNFEDYLNEDLLEGLTNEYLEEKAFIASHKSTDGKETAERSELKSLHNYMFFGYYLVDEALRDTKQMGDRGDLTKPAKEVDSDKILDNMIERMEKHFTPKALQPTALVQTKVDKKITNLTEDFENTKKKYIFGDDYLLKFQNYLDGLKGSAPNRDESSIVDPLFHYLAGMLKDSEVIHKLQNPDGKMSDEQFNLFSDYDNYDKPKELAIKNALKDFFFGNEKPYKTPDIIEINELCELGPGELYTKMQKKGFKVPVVEVEKHLNPDSQKRRTRAEKYESLQTNFYEGVRKTVDDFGKKMYEAENHFLLGSKTVAGELNRNAGKASKNENTGNQSGEVKDDIEGLESQLRTTDSWHGFITDSPEYKAMKKALTELKTVFADMDKKKTVSMETVLEKMEKLKNSAQSYKDAHTGPLKKNQEKRSALMEKFIINMEQKLQTGYIIAKRDLEYDYNKEVEAAKLQMAEKMVKVAKAANIKPSQLAEDVGFKKLTANMSLKEMQSFKEADEKTVIDKLIELDKVQKKIIKSASAARKKEPAAEKNTNVPQKKTKTASK